MLKKLAAVVGMGAILAMPFSVFAAPAEKVTVCHFTSSETNPIVFITISVNALQTHLDNGDLLFNSVTGQCGHGGPAPE